MFCVQNVISREFLSDDMLQSYGRVEMEVSGSQFTECESRSCYAKAHCCLSMGF